MQLLQKICLFADDSILSKLWKMENSPQSQKNYVQFVRLYKTNKK